jgi:hypothetical protein
MTPLIAPDAPSPDVACDLVMPHSCQKQENTDEESDEIK